MLAGVPVFADAVAELADTVRPTGADELADRLEQALDDDVALLALTIDQRALILAALGDPPDGLPSFGPCCSTSTSGGNGRGSIFHARVESPGGSESAAGDSSTLIKPSTSGGRAVGVNLSS